VRQTRSWGLPSSTRRRQKRLAGLPLFDPFYSITFGWNGSNRIHPSAFCLHGIDRILILFAELSTNLQILHCPWFLFWCGHRIEIIFHLHNTFRKCSAPLHHPLLFRVCTVTFRFDQAIVSLFWTAAGMGLPDSVHYKYPDESINFAVVFFFASFILILNWTLLQVFIFRHFAKTEKHILIVEDTVLYSSNNYRHSLPKYTAA
jgi:hypothetical protein